MRLSVVASALLLTGLAAPAFAQQTPAPQLEPLQAEGRALFAKSCSICHLPPQYNAPTYGPRLSQSSLGGNDSVLREVISNGTPRMPAWKHMYKPAQVDAIIAYLKTVPTPAPAPAPASQTR